MKDLKEKVAEAYDCLSDGLPDSRDDYESAESYRLARVEARLAFIGDLLEILVFKSEREQQPQ